ncbi:13175_t:CDS:2 [Acaulospora colombiana]|uniref:13175_t:CDS:1 n=1 Tax=Acaulospora colombiana TaxID=27376 RepID=A0ACA9K8C1_9GLOM|nr:13175_t:CDS:2 [Acaulospora colombiana]
MTEERSAIEDSAGADSTVRDSVITYSTDVVGSSVEESQTNETYSTKPKSVTNDDSPPFYRRRRFWATCAALSVVILVILIPLLILVIFPAIAQKTVDNSHLNLNSIVISNPGNNSFLMSSDANVTNGGSFKSTIEFQTPVTMYWNDMEIGNVEFDPIHVSGGYASASVSNKTFTITNETAISDFSTALLNEDTLNVTFKSTISVKFMGITRGGMSLNKEVTIQGCNKLGTPKVTYFSVDQPDNSTLRMNVTVSIEDPSSVSISMGKVGVGVSYNGTFISNMTIDDFNLTPGNLSVTMYGNASVPQSPEDRENFGVVMSAYLTNHPVITTSTGEYDYPNHHDPVSWLTPAVKTLNLNASIGDAPNGPPQLITGLDFGLPSFNFSLAGISFSSHNTVASYKLPFDIRTNIQQISQNVTMYYGETPLATFETIQFSVQDNLHGALTMNIPPTLLNVPPGSEIAFSSFVAKLSLLSQVEFNITGTSNVSADTIIGLLPIPNLPFTLNVTLPGFSNFSATPPKVNSVTVVDGTISDLIMQINATLFNPSNTSISLGEASFEIVFANSTVGYANSSISLVPGANELTFTATMDPAHNSLAQQLLNNYMEGNTSDVTLSGYENSTDLPYMSLALSQLKLSAPLLPLPGKLITNSKLRIQDVSDAGVSSVVDVTMFNPFVATMNVLTVGANITVDGDLLAQMPNVGPLALPGNASTTLPGLPVNMNLDRTVLFGLLRRQAQLVGLDTSVIDALITIGKIPVPGVQSITTIDPDKIKNFDIVSYVETALATIKVDMSLFSDVKIGKYEMPFPYVQLDTQSHTDSSIVKLLPLLSRPIAQALIDGSTLVIDSLSLQDLTEDSFVTVINGAIKNAGPLPAVVSFPNGADLIFNNAENATVNALKLSIDGVGMTKEVSLKGAGGFKNAVTISSYDLPRDAPNGGIVSVINATLVNPGSVGISLESVSFDILSGSTKIGEETSSGFTMVPSGSSEMKLVGRLIPQSGDGVNVIANIFADVLNKKPVPLVAKGTGLQPPISWLIPAFTQLSIDSVLPPKDLGKLVPSVTINEISMKFTPDTAYDPITSSKNLTAQINIPFGFTLSITEMSEEIVIVNGNTNMARLSIPQSKAQTIGRNVITTYSDVDLKVFDDAHSSFDSFVKDLTIGDSKKFGLVGSSNVLAKTPVATIPLNNISIDVETSLAGFEGLKAKPVTINGLDVTSGTSSVLTVPINTSLFNPSPVTISAGDITFNVISVGLNMGSVVINDLTIVPGNNNLSATTFLSPPSPAISGLLLSQFIANVTQPLSIVGSQNSTNIDSLKEAFSQIKIDTFLPPLGRRLLLSSFVAFQNDTLKTGVAFGGFTLLNPFKADITITQINQVNITFHGIPVGSITDLKIPVTIPGTTTFTSPPIPIKVNLFPPDLVKIIEKSAEDKNIDIKPLEPLLKLIGGGKSPSPSKRQPTSDAHDRSPFDLLKTILAELNVDINMNSNVLVDKFPASPLTIVEKGVPTTVNNSDIIITQMAAPISQGLVNASTIVVNSAAISDEQATSFNLHIDGDIKGIGDVQAKITFPSGLNVSSLGKDLGVVKLPPVTSDGSGARINSSAPFQITDVNNFAFFALTLLGGPSANWTLAANDVQVEAFGIPLSGIQMNKDVPLQGFNGLRQLTIIEFEIPGTAPDGNFELAVKASLVNPSNVGIALGAIGFDLFTENQLIGPINATDVTLEPKSTTEIPFTGEITIKDPKILSEVIAKLFSGKGNLTVKGDTIHPPGAKGDVPWLSTPFKLLSLDVPISNGSGPPPNPVKSVTIKSMNLTFTQSTAFDPDSSSDGLVAEIQLPVKLPTPITSVSQNITIKDENGAEVASLEIPSSPATQKGNIVTTTYQHVPLKVIDQKAFSLFLGGLMIATEKSFSVAGNVTASMGKIELPTIPFDVKTSMKGLQGLKSSPVTISNLLVTGGSEKGITLGMKVSLTNPSDVQVSAGDLTFDVLFGSQKVGTTTIPNIVLARGKNDYPATFIFSPIGDPAVKAGADLIGNLMTNKPSPLVIQGNAQTTNISSLTPIFSLLSLETTLNGLPAQVIESITVTVDPSVLKTKQGLASFVVVNPLNVPYSITGIVATASFEGQKIGEVNVPKVPPTEIPALSNKNVSGIPFTFTMNMGSLPGLIGKTINIDIDASTSAVVGQ